MGDSSLESQVELTETAKRQKINMYTRGPTCWQSIQSGALTGFGTGMVIGLLTGLMSGFGNGMRGRALMRTTGKACAVSGGSFMVFMALDRRFEADAVFKTNI